MKECEQPLSHTHDDVFVCDNKAKYLITNTMCKEKRGTRVGNPVYSNGVYPNRGEEKLFCKRLNSHDGTLRTIELSRRDQVLFWGREVCRSDQQLSGPVDGPGGVGLLDDDF